MHIQNETPTLSSPGARFFFWRRACQIGIAALFIALPFMNKTGLHGAYGNFLSFSIAGVPLADPLSVAQVGANAFAFTPRMLAGAGLTLLLALVMGNVFCSWLCPFGLLSEWVAGRRKTPPPQAAAQPLPQPSPAERVRLLAARRALGYGFFVKLALASAGLLFCGLALAQPYLNQLSLPGWYSRLWQAAALDNAGAAAVAFGCLAAVLLLERIAGRRIWCRYLCPQSVLIALVKMANPVALKVGYEKSRCSCRGERPCREACSLELDPRSGGACQRLACTNCADCVDACASRGKALKLGFSRQDAARE